jgi:hypothetical protein
MFKNWREIYQLLQSKKIFDESLNCVNKNHSASIEELSYLEVKNLAKKYQDAKLIVIFLTFLIKISNLSICFFQSCMKHSNRTISDYG